MRRRRRARRGCPLACDQRGRLSFTQSAYRTLLEGRVQPRLASPEWSPAAPASAVDANFVQSVRSVDERDRARQSFQWRRPDQAHLGADRHVSACGFAHKTPATVPHPSPGGHYLRIPPHCRSPVLVSGSGNERVSVTCPPCRATCRTTSMTAACADVSLGSAGGGAIENGPTPDHATTVARVAGRWRWQGLVTPSCRNRDPVPDGPEAVS